MDLTKSGKLFYDLRKAKGMTQKEVAERLGVLPKTVSKWETGKGFPDVSVISSLAEVLGVSEKVLLSGTLVKNRFASGNMKRTKFYVCDHCGGFLQGLGDHQVICCGKILTPEPPKAPEEGHLPSVSVIENDFYIEWHHDMTKEHYIGFAAYVGVDRVLMVKLYPEQDGAVRFPKMHGGKLYFYCNKHGLFEYKC